MRFILRCTDLRTSSQRRITYVKLVLSYPVNRTVPLLGAFRKWQKTTISLVMPVCMPVRLHVTSRLLLNGFSPNFLFAYVSKICLEKSNLIKTREE
jgi:hypothetical protein